MEMAERKTGPGQYIAVCLRRSSEFRDWCQAGTSAEIGLFEDPASGTRRVEFEIGVAGLGERLGKTHAAAGQALTTLGNFLKEEGKREEFEAAAKEVLAWRIAEAMKAQILSRKRLAEHSACMPNTSK
jgi:hypothetical protein